MTRVEAIEIRSQQLLGRPVDERALAEAIEILRASAMAPTPRKARAPRQKRVARPGGPERDEVAPDNPWGLSVRQCQLLELLANGDRQMDAAERLGINAKTAAVHMDRAKTSIVVETAMSAVIAWDRFKRPLREPAAPVAPPPAPTAVEPTHIVRADIPVQVVDFYSRDELASRAATDARHSRS